MDASPTSVGTDVDSSVLLAAFDQATVGLAVVALGGRVVRSNGAMTKLLGALNDWDSFPAVVREVAVLLPAEVMQADLDHPETILRPGLRLRWHVSELDGYGWLVQAEDVTAQAAVVGLREAVRVAGERLSTIASLNRLVEQADFDVDVATIVEMIAERARSLIGASGIAVGRIEGDDVVYWLAAGAREVVGIQTALVGSLTGVCINSGQPAVCQDTEADGRVNAAAVEAARIRSMIVVPLRREGRISGVVNVFSQWPHNFQTGDVQTVELVAGVISAVYGHAADLAGKRTLLAELQASVDVLRASESQLAHAALHDPLTGLPNRALFHNRLAQAFAVAARHDRQVGVMFVDLDNFKQVNDSLGHEAGDALLREVAVRLEACLRTSDSAARIGGDEFTVLCEVVDASHDVVRIAERITASIAQPLLLSGVEVTPSASIGVAFGRGPTDTPERVLKAADDALYQAKRQGRGRYCLAAQGEAPAPGPVPAPGGDQAAG